MAGPQRRTIRPVASRAEALPTVPDPDSHAICETCGTQFAAAAPERCPICEDPRQYVGADGQSWTTLAALRAGHHNWIACQGELEGVGTVPSFAIGQRALLVPHGRGRLMWDCVTLFDEDSAALIERRGGLTGIAISHPHYYASMVEWARRFDCPIHLHADDAEWIMRPDPHIELWQGERLQLGDGVTLLRTGGHFPGAAVLHWAAGDDGQGTLLVGDICLPVPDRRYVTFLWSYPNRVPLPAASVARIGEVFASMPFRTLHAAFWDQHVDDAPAVVQRSVTRYLAALQTPGGL